MRFSEEFVVTDQRNERSISQQLTILLLRYVRSLDSDSPIGIQVATM